MHSLISNCVIENNILLPTSSACSYPNSFIPEVLQNHTSGTAIPKGEAMWSESNKAPFTYVPGVGFSDMEAYYDDEGNKVNGEFFCLTDNGFGSSE
jgi:hypothetical protein